MLTIKVSDLAEAYEAMQELARRKLKINPSFWLSRQIRKLEPDYRGFIEKRDELIRQYGAEETAGSGAFRVKPENAAVYTEAINELVKAELEVAVEPRSLAFLAIDEIEPHLLGAMWFLWDEQPAA